MEAKKSGKLFPGEALVEFRQSVKNELLMFDGEDPGWGDSSCRGLIPSDEY